MKKRNGFKASLMFLFAALLISVSTNAFAQNNRVRNCCTGVTGITVEQQEQITDLQNQHQLKMESLRTERRSSTNVETKQNVRERMLAEVKQHNDSVKKLLSPAQQKQYMQNRNVNGQNMAGNSRCGSGKRGNGKQNCSGNRNGKGSRRGNGNGRCQI